MVSLLSNAAESSIHRKYCAFGVTADHEKDEKKNMQQTLRLAALRRRRRSTFRNSNHGNRGIISLLLLYCCYATIARAEESTATSRGSAGHIADIVRVLCARLQIDNRIDVRIDESNAKMVSSEPLPGANYGYRISFDRQFLEDLDDDEIAGAIAHELGHVWIFSHHPFLQTEELANEVALKVVTRETMKKVYGKVWAHTGTVGDVDKLLGPVRESEAAKSVRILP